MKVSISIKVSRILRMKRKNKNLLVRNWRVIKRRFRT
jgi:hypothetical protein